MWPLSSEDTGSHLDGELKVSATFLDPDAMIRSEEASGHCE